MTARLLLDEHIHADSRVERTWLAAETSALRIVVEVDGGVVRDARISAAVIRQVVGRYARPLEHEVIAALDDAPRLSLGDGTSLARMRWRAGVDADGRDWLVQLAPGAEPQAALATTITAALRFLLERADASAEPIPNS